LRSAKLPKHEAVPNQMRINLLVNILSISLPNIEDIVLQKEWMEDDLDLKGFEKLDKFTVC
jgi:hypothetical protein